MRIAFIRCDPEGNDATPTWWAAYGGHEKAFAVCYSPAFGLVARVLVREPFTLMKEHEHTFVAAILQLSEERKFLFTPDGFEIDVSDEVLDMSLRRPMTLHLLHD